MPQSPLFALRQLTKAWIRKEAEEMSRWLTEDITEIGPVFDTALSGRKNFLRKYQPYFDGEALVADYRILRPRVVSLSPKLALVYFHYTMRTTKAGESVRDSHGKESVVAEKTRGGWRIKFIHWHEEPQT